MISLTNLSMLYRGRLLFDSVNLNLVGCNRYSVVGANGTGKSTFLRLIAGDETPCGGEIAVAKQATVGWLKQDQFRYEENSPIEVVLQGKPALWHALKEKEQILSRSNIDDKIGYRLATLEECIINLEGYTAALLAENLLTGLGVRQNQQKSLMKQLSGGYKLRVLLAQALFENPDILLLDEPTNHLDIVSITWLEQYFKKTFKGILVFISHDRNFLNKLSTHVLDIDYGEIREYVGNYDSFLKEKQQVAERKLSEKKYLEQKIIRMQAFVVRFRDIVLRSRQAMSRAKALEKIELPDIKRSSRSSPHFLFKQVRPSGKVVLGVEAIRKSFDERVILKNVCFTVNRCEKIALIGPNGIGKSTLLKILLGFQLADAGTFKWGFETHISYFAQDHHEQLTKNSIVLDWLTEQRGSENTSDKIRKVLGQLLFTKEDVCKNIATLSGGETSRLLFANIILQLNNVLVLDEPTNHLDIESREALALALKNYDGTILFVSHDRHFVTTIATRIITLTDKGIVDFQGSYSEYLKKYGEDYLNQEWLSLIKK